MLTDRITLAPTAELEPEDYFSSALGVIFPDDITNQHGDPSTPVIYTSPTYGKIFLSLADPVGEDSRKLFAQYLWNAGVYMAVALEDAVMGTVHGEGLAGQEEDGADRNKRREVDGDESRSSTVKTLDTQDDTMLPSSILKPLTGEQTASPPLTMITSHKEKSPWDVHNETVLELGAGTGLAGIIAAKAGARHILITDYPAPEVLANLQANVEQNLSADEKGRCLVTGHEWGAVPNGDRVVEGDDRGGSRISIDSAEHDHIEEHQDQLYHQKFTRILVADCLWMPSQHQNLHRSIAYYLSPAVPTSSAPSPSPSPSIKPSPSGTTTTTTTTTTTNQTSGGRALIVAGFHTGRAKMAPFFDESALAAAGLCLESIIERDAVGRERPWTWPRERTTGTLGGDSGADEGNGGGGGGGDGEGRAGISERKRWLVVAVLKKL